MALPRVSGTHSRAFLTVISLFFLALGSVCAIADASQSIKLQPVDSKLIPLHVYVYRNLAPAAECFEAGDYKGSLSILNKARIICPGMQSEMHYIQGLCFQSLKQFDASKAEYQWVSVHAEERGLQDRAKAGLAEIARKQRIPAKFRIIFWRTEVAPDIF